ncbi:MAG: helix-turn-helix domain-containing protein [Pseudonocardiaceae bacterium]
MLSDIHLARWLCFITMTGPTIRRHQLGSELRRLREAAGVSRAEAAQIVGCSLTKITHMEIGRSSPRKTELIVLLQRYGADDRETVDELEELRIEAAKRGWWSTARLPGWLAGYVGLEADATSLRTLQLELIPGLLQTEQYARAVHGLSAHLASPEDVDRRVAARMRRQARLDDPDRPLQFSAVISEAALQRCARHTTVAGDQLRHLLDRAQLRNVELHVLPFSVGLHSSMAGSFTLLGFPRGLLPDAAYQEYAVGGHLIDDESIVARLDRLYGELRDQALDVDESLTVISELAANTG